MLTTWREHMAFRPERFNPIELARTPNAKVVLACFEPGQFIPIHKPGVDLVLLVLEGSGRFADDEGEHPLAEGALAFVPAGGRRGIRADTRMVVLHVVTPPPSEADHAGVAVGLKRGTWR